MVGRAVALALCLVGCNGAGDRAGEEVILRVSASHGFGEFVPGPELSGATAYALELVYAPLHHHARVVAADEKSVLLARRPESPHSAAALAEALAFQDLVSAETAGEDEIRAEFSSLGAARYFAGWQLGAFDLGPFAIARAGKEKIRLRARDDLAIDLIEIVAAGEEQQWRRLLARNVDVVPATDARRAERLADVGSIRRIEIPQTSPYGLVFHVEHPKLADASVRRGVAHAIDPRAIAEVVGGRPAAILPASEEEARERARASLPDALSVLILDTDDVARRAAEVLRHQFGRREVSIVIEEASVPEAFARVQGGRYELAFFPLRVEIDEQLLDQLANFGYQNNALEAAIRSGDEVAAQAILAREVPFVPLFEARYFAAIDEKFCGGEPERHTSWRWLADLRPCGDGESE